ncbi:LuxR family transcriptional regulator [Pseudonocardiaceae bacterium YIM PH 21723]|nr:LuxR family transcriptional regulator [Pseudonocardiaceae bacterium YIM PH 21723]
MDQHELMGDDRLRALLLALVRRVQEIDPSGRVPTLDIEGFGMRFLLLRTDREPDHQLSPREREIAKMVGLGLTNKMIASMLDISLYTVSAHLRRIFVKLDVQTRAAMVAALSGPAGHPMRRPALT